MARHRPQTKTHAGATAGQNAPPTPLPTEPITATGPSAAANHTPTEILFATTLFVSAILLFAVEPMFAKMALPLLGGAPAVWNTCLVFYQAILLVGYLYVHLSLKWLGPRRQAAVHLLVLCLPWIVLPIGLAEGWVPPANAFPVVWLWMLLCLSVGLPFFVASASVPMLQVWFSRTGGRSASDPYFLYAASNLGSLLALLGYPLLIESQLTLKAQAWWWAVGYGMLMLLVFACALQVWRSPQVVTFTKQGPRDQPCQRLGMRRRLHWLALSFVPSSLLMGVTTYISTDIAQIPLLWVIPLAIYLLTFVLVFARRSILPLRWMIRVQPCAIVAAGATLALNTDAPAQLLVIGMLQLLAFFTIAMVCHGQLAGDRPSESQLTEFYLWMSLGGMLGGLFNALVAPLVFSGPFEYPLILAASCLLRPHLVISGDKRRVWPGKAVLSVVVLLLGMAVAWNMKPQAGAIEWSRIDIPAFKLALMVSAMAAALLLRARPLPFALGIAALLVISSLTQSNQQPTLLAQRSFFGVLRVRADPLWNAHILYHGSTLHGAQSLDTAGRHEPWTYYHRSGPLGQIFGTLQSRRPMAEIGVLGLGTGTIAAYGQPGERITFYEIDPAVKSVAEVPRYFTYLADCRAKVEIILGDARLQLVHGPPRRFDLLVVDVFSSDSVPIHLVTREALAIYRQRLTDHGLLAVHVSARYLDLLPILGRLAEDAGMAARSCFGQGNTPVRQPSSWVVMAGHADDLSALSGVPTWEPLGSDGGCVWTDDFSNVLEVVRLQRTWSSLWPSKWWWSVTDEADRQNSVGFIMAGQSRWDEAMAHYQKAVELDPNNAVAHNGLGQALSACGRADMAIEHFQKAIEIKPNFAEAQGNVGLALAGRGQVDAAIVHYQKALEINPKLAEIHNNLGVALASRGQYEAAITHYEKAVELNPATANAHCNLGNVLAGRRQYDAAIVQYQQALAVQPDFVAARHNLALAQAQHDKIAKAVADWRETIRSQPKQVAALNQLAWTLATCPEASVRNGAEAVELAQQAVQLTDGKNPEVLDTLAAAYAEAGQFSKALETARKAEALAVKQDRPAARDSIRARIRLYEAGKPVRYIPSASGGSANPRN